ncbi:hydrogen peroxide-inducible genes activator [uncultured Cohaesibacter sp.]|uniref:hydrogen peroxide-inducible genes activator n=1 Tax=uncultured Cohaesibacter sp. TaxID=1002546 RepID=UPI0029C61623|nr:hydrogen peroxide-inducible genes activator [uncultured Cohaesibacter sp.]
MLPSLRQLTFLVALSEELHFSNAAKRCNVTQSTLSAGLKDLEAILQVSLAERTKRSVIMTPIGARIAAKARELLTDAEDLVTMASEASAPLSGDLHLGAIPTVGPFLLPRLRPLIKVAYPDLRLFLREELTEPLLEGLRSGRLDAALIALPHNTGELMTHELFDDGYHLVVPMDHPLSCATRTDLTGLRDQKFMLLEKGHCLQQHALSAYPGLINRNEEFDATSLPTLMAMVEEGLGTTLIPDLAIDAGLTRGHQVHRISLPDALPRRIALVWRRSSAREADFLLLADLLREARQSLKAKGRA